MAERNAHVRFPELVTPARALERLVVDMAHGRLLPYAKLPPTLTAANIESYANWMSSLTQRDPRRAERGAVLHVQSDNNQIIFPTDPDVGDNRSCGWVIEKKRTKFIPTINIHSHPTDVCHSPAPNDMTILISGNAEQDNYFLPPAMLVTTPGHNYLMIKSQETPTEDQWTVYKKEDALFDRNGFREFSRFGSQLREDISPNQYWQLLKDVESRFFEGSLYVYYEKFMHAINLAEAYKIGFYRSDKDGNYVRLTREMIMEQMTQALEQAIYTTLHGSPLQKAA